MGQTLDLGRRIELHSMDKHCGDISLGLYEQQTDSGSQFVVHTYSSFEGAVDRVAFLTDALRRLAGLEDVEGAPGWLRFHCEGTHLKALRRVFSDACKLETGAELEPKPLVAHDKKADCELAVHALGNGRYQMRAASDQPQAAKRATAVAKGYVKLCEMELASEENNEFVFSCGHDHNPLLGMLLFRAQNVRAAVREDELSASRGVLAAPSQRS